MIPKLTHSEACALVESALERVSKTLMYVRLMLDINQPKPNTLPGIGACSENRIKGLVDEANLLCNINYYGAYMSGARAMFCALERMSYLDFKKKQDWLIAKAQLKLFMDNNRNLDWFLHEMPNDVDIFTELERDKRGKVIGAKAKFYRKKLIREEI